MMELNKIYNEDCIDTMRRMPDGFIDMVLTSPPYDNLRTYNNDIDKTWGEHIWKPIISELYRVTKEGGVVVWIVSDATINGSETGTSFRQALYAMECGFNLHDTMIYRRQGAFPMDEHNRYWQDFEYCFVFSNGKPIAFNPIKETSIRKHGSKIHRRRNIENVVGSTLVHRTATGQKSLSNVWDIPAGNNISTKDKIAFSHPAILPEKLASNHIYTWSNESDLIYDPFMGSGTTAKAAHILNRNWIGSEISSEYCEIANKRIYAVRNQLRMF